MSEDVQRGGKIGPLASLFTWVIRAFLNGENSSCPPAWETRVVDAAIPMSDQPSNPLAG